MTLLIVLMLYTIFNPVSVPDTDHVPGTFNENVIINREYTDLRTVKTFDQTNPNN